MILLRKKLFNGYSILVKTLFLILLFGVLSFGRSFSIIHVEINHFPIFVTEIILLISLPLIIAKEKDFLRIPSLFLNIIVVYFLFGLFYSLRGILDENLFVFRDFAVLCGYTLFLLLSFICFNSFRLIKIIIFIMVVANFIALLVGQIFILGLHPFWFYEFISQAKTFQIGIVYGISSSFLLVFYNYFKNKTVRLFILVMVSINLYMFIIFGIRSLWVSTFCLVIFLMLVSGIRDMSRAYLKVLVSFIFVSVILFYVDFIVFKSSQLDILIGRSRGFMHAVSELSENSPFSNNPNKLTLKNELKYNVSSTPFDTQDRSKSENSSKTAKTFPLNEFNASAFRNESERIGYDNIIWRKKVWSQTIKFVSSSYLFGKGFGLYPSYNVWGIQKLRSPFVDSNITPAHNYFLTIFYKMGLLGLGLFLIINIYVFIYSIRYLKKCNSKLIKHVLIGALGALVFWHVTALFFDVIDSPPTSILLWIFIGLIFAVTRIDKELIVI